MGRSPGCRCSSVGTLRLYLCFFFTASVFFLCFYAFSLYLCFFSVSVFFQCICAYLWFFLYTHYTRTDYHRVLPPCTTTVYYYEDFTILYKLLLLLILV